MGNQCCSAKTTTPDQQNAPIQQENTTFEEGGENGIVQDKPTTAVHAQQQVEIDVQNEATAQEKIEEQIEAQVDENKENNTAISQYKFRKQLESLSRALSSVEQLKSLSHYGALVSTAISQLEGIIAILSQSLYSSSYLRDFKTNIIGLYGDFQGFRSFHLRYTVDTAFYNDLYVISNAFNFLQQVAETHTSNGKINYEAFSKELTSGESHSTFEEHRQNLGGIRDVYNRIAGQNFSTLPNYLYITFSQQAGFELWNKLFPNDFETSNVVFSQKYAEYCHVDEGQILSIISLLDSSNDQRVDIYQWMEFVQENQAILTSEGAILPEKIDAFQDEIAARNFALQAAPQKIAEGQYLFSSGVEYTGELDDLNRKIGKGRVCEENYELSCFFVEDLANGIGEEKRKGVVYQGDFQNGLYHGYGTLTFPNGRSYTGNFANHQFHGEGVLTGDDGIKYQGDWRKSTLEFGKITYHNGARYVGQLTKNFFKHALGSLFFAPKNEREDLLQIDGQWANDAPALVKVYNDNETVIYEGQLDNWSITGQGKRFYIDGSYEGSLLRDKKNGDGVLIYKNGDKFSGRWQEDAQLRGVYTYGKEKDHFYDGEWTNGVMEGRGKFSYSSGGLYEGEVKDGKRHGQGTYKYKNGNVYTGQWVDNNQQGDGKFVYAGAAPGEEGDVFQGEFKNGKFNGFGHYIYKKSGKQYIGNWEDDKWSGNGKFVDATGAVLKSGHWKNDKIEREIVESDLNLPSEKFYLLLNRQH